MWLTIQWLFLSLTLSILFIKQTIITKNLQYKDGFDLNKGVEAKIHTLLSRHCTNGPEVQSSWSEATYWTSEQG
jgi:interleukin 13 receptor alpha-2